MAMWNEIRSLQYDASGYTDENSMSRLLIGGKPSKINQNLTYLFGRDTDKFPLSFITEGQGNVKEIDEVQYWWDVQGRMKITEEVVSHGYSAGDAPGINFTTFYVVFKSQWFPRDWKLIAPDRTIYRVMAEPQVVVNGYRYALNMITTNPNDFCILTNLAVTKHWVLAAPAVAESKSRGNKSNKQAPGKLVNQIGFQRFSMKIAGNAANKVTEIEIPTKTGGTSMRWMPEEMRQFEDLKRQMIEEDLWTSKYNRLADGNITLIDAETGEPIPQGAGILEQVEEANFDTYGYDLSVNKIKNTINDVFYNDTDSGKMEVMLHCGSGFADDFDRGIKSEGSTNQYWYKMSEEEIRNSKGTLEYGAYFTRYRHIKGHIITVQVSNFFDFGSIAQMERDNGDIHPRTGYPMFSHTGVFLDQSVYNGERNIKMACMKGQVDLVGIVRGITPLPVEWAGAGLPNAKDLGIISHDRDEASYETKTSRGLHISNITRCFMLRSEL
jgi:hypothetical protein